MPCGSARSGASKNPTSTTFRRLAALALAGVFVATAAASPSFAAKPPGTGEETLGNNLSVPAYFVPSYTGTPALRAGACGALIPATGPTSTTYPGYYLQKTEATWQAECATAATLGVVAYWGDNLTARPSLTSRQPLRVEMGLLYTPPAAMQGFVVDNLTPNVEDRLATYGTLGVATSFPVARVYDSGATLKIEKLDAPLTVVYNGPMTAEINSTGAVVYGYNWGIKGRKSFPQPGVYRLTFTTGATTITGIDPSDQGAINEPSFNTTSSSLTITILPANSGGGKGGGGRP